MKGKYISIDSLAAGAASIAMAERLREHGASEEMITHWRMELSVFFMKMDMEHVALQAKEKEAA